MDCTADCQHSGMAAKLITFGTFQKLFRKFKIADHCKLITMLIQNPIQLYRHLLKCIQTLPPGVQDYYRHFVRQVNFI